MPEVGDMLKLTEHTRFMQGFQIEALCVRRVCPLLRPSERPLHTRTSPRSFLQSTLQFPAPLQEQHGSHVRKLCMQRQSA